MRGLAAGRRTISWRAEPGADTDWIELSIARTFSPQVCGSAVPGALPQASVARAFSPQVCGSAVPGALPQAWIGRAVGAGSLVALELLASTYDGLALYSWACRNRSRMCWCIWSSARSSGGRFWVMRSEARCMRIWLRFSIIRRTSAFGLAELPTTFTLGCCLHAPSLCRKSWSG